MARASDVAANHTLRAFTEPRRSREERRAAGRALRDQVPLEVHAELVDSDRDPLALLQQQESTRDPELVPLR
ncbi:MAG: hypothetical protein HGA44_12770 [Cellulomonadaceae bacterium]|nr:hypothetical protein [Cellulomonadaceae bacterium]